MDNLMGWVMGTAPSPFAGLFGEGLTRRRNTPSGAYDHILGPDTPTADQQNRLWAVDRVLEPQTLVHFIEFAINGELLSGKKTALPILGDEYDYIQVPFSQWAPAPYSSQEISLVEAIMGSTGSFQDRGGLVPVAKELLAMKARVWEGIMPLSERRWMDLDLDNPSQFHQACQFISAVTDVFHYLNIPEIKASLRETFNRIWAHLDKFDKAVHALQANTTNPDFSMAALWHEYIEDHFSSIAARSNRWVIEHIDRLRTPILEALAQDTDIDALDSDDDYGESLADLIHDLHEGAVQADSSIFIPTDGYHGASLRSQDDVPGNTSHRYREEPITFSASTEKRKADYYFRVRYLSHLESFKMESLLDRSVVSHAKDQVRAEVQARKELRGNDTTLDEPPRWVAQARRHFSYGKTIPWAFIGFRTSYGHSDEEWERFKSSFHADISNWGSELGDIDDIRALSVVEWHDVEGTVDGKVDGIAAAEKQFETLSQDEELMERFNNEVYLVADKESIDSYLRPNATAGHILAVEAGFDVDEADAERLSESPGYDGWLRLQGSLVWDDLSALMLMQTQFLMDLWPLAKDDPEKVYRHPLGPVRG
ncbi:hypothetical protein A9K55_000010 [Cordyceps militaris]|uniref:Uncharacterized protein n=1 Tax=Cordyceps militaris TaxID=73501 RepID=A0A2H4SVP3_CORMI|nr:hypothetical protein A9K55_000010 [Cordyceps militaris]